MHAQLLPTISYISKPKEVKWMLSNVNNNKLFLKPKACNLQFDVFTSIEELQLNCGQLTDMSLIATPLWGPRTSSLKENIK